ncbi:MAG: hypothetical protein AAGA21_04275 [Pseudomonadota bacterium]
MIVDGMRKFFAVLMIGLFAGALTACGEGGPADSAGDAAEETTSN